MYIYPSGIARDPSFASRHPCPRCFRTYKHRSHMMRHYKYECDSLHRFECPYCGVLLRQRTQAWRHIKARHPNRELYCTDIGTNTKLVRQDYWAETQEYAEPKLD